MPRYAYDRLSALDNSFLVLEKPNAYMHVASTMLFEAGPLKRPDGGIDADKIRAMIGASLHQIPRYRQRLAWIPFENHAVWVDDENFQLEFHVRHTSLPRPGSEEQLKRLSARVMQQHLDRSRPLWEIWIVEGIEKDRFALISKVHHCMVDGVSGVDLMKMLMRLSPDATLPDRVAALHAAAGAFGDRTDAPRVDATRGFPAHRAARSAAPRERSAGHAPGTLRAAARRRRDARRDAALGVADAAEPPDRPAPPLRLDGDGPRRREGGAQGARRFAERRGADGRDGRRAALPRTPRRAHARPRLPRHGARLGARGRRVGCARQSRVGVAGSAADRRRRSARAAEGDRGAHRGTEGFEERRRRRGADRRARVDAVAAAGARRAQRDAAAALQHGGDERAGSADPDVHGGRADARDVPERAAHGQPGTRHRAALVRRTHLLGLQRGLRRRAGPRGVRRRHARRARGADARSEAALDAADACLLQGVPSAGFAASARSAAGLASSR